MNPAVVRAKAALDALAEAMLSGDPDRVLSHEMAVAAAAADLSRLARTADASSFSRDALSLRADLQALRGSLSRCLALGALTADLSSLLFAAPTGYSATGLLGVAPATASLFSTRS